MILLGAVCTAFACIKDTRTEAIQAALKSDETLTAKELKLLDMDENGALNMADLLLAKRDALIGKHGDVILYLPTEAKQIGRTAYHEDTKTLWCSLSGSGISFQFTGASCEFTLVGDSAYSGGDAQAARYAYYVNDVLQAEEQLTEAERCITVSGDAAGSTIVRIVKLSESAQSAFGIRDIAVTAADGDAAVSLEAMPAKSRYIEFIGDSITCGYGVDGEYGKGTFKTANENATKAYAFLTAQNLDADYSLVSYSGHGVVSGYTTPGKLNSSQIVPKLYGQCGESYATLEGGKKIGEDLWDFSVQPDLIVINLGTNDASYTGSDAARQKEFAAAYVEFLKQIRENNPDSPILCTLGIMGQTLCDAITLAVSDYTAETGDTNINTMWFDVQDQATDGLAVDWHPSAATHQKAADRLSAFIKDWLGW